MQSQQKKKNEHKNMRIPFGAACPPIGKPRSFSSLAHRCLAKSRPVLGITTNQCCVAKPRWRTIASTNLSVQSEQCAHLPWPRRELEASRSFWWSCCGNMPVDMVVRHFAALAIHAANRPPLAHLHQAIRATSRFQLVVLTSIAIVNVAHEIVDLASLVENA